MGALTVSNADSKVLREEAREVLKEAMLSYEGSDVHVVIYALTRARSWNALQTELSRTDTAPSNPQRVATICEAVEQHLEDELRSYLGIGSAA